MRLGILFFIFLRFGHQFFNLLLELHLLGLDALVQGLPAAFDVTIYDHLTALVGVEGLTDGALRDVICLLLTIFKLGLQSINQFFIESVIDSKRIYFR